MIPLIIALSVAIVISAVCLWLGMKITKVDGTFIAMFLIATVSTLLALIPTGGWIIGTIVMFILICKWTDASFFPDAVLMVIVARGVAILGTFFLLGLMSSG